MMIALRVVHIVLGVFWAGTLFFLATFLEPSVRAAGPEGAKVMQALQQRRLLDILPAIAALTILSGLVLFWRVSGGLGRAWLASGAGHALSLGGIVALVAFGLGVGVMRPASLGAARLGAELNSLPQGPEREARAARAQSLRRRAAVTARWVAVLLALSVAAMAAARYV